MPTRRAAGAATIATLGLLIGLLSMQARCDAQAQPQARGAGSEEDYGYAYLTPEQREGRNTWYFWTGGNEKFWVKMA